MIRIKFTNLGQAAQNRVAMTAQGEAVLQLTDGDGIKLSKQVLKLSDLGKISGEYAIPITVDATDVNEAILSEYNTPATLNPRDEYEVLVSVDSVLLPFTRARVIEYDENKYTIQLLYSNNHWLQAASLLRSCDIEMGSYEISKLSIEQNWLQYNDGDSDVLLTFADFGNWVDERVTAQNSTAGAKTIAVEDVRPFFRLSAFLKKGFCKIGWDLESELFNLKFVNALTVYDLRPDYAELSRKKSKITGKNNGPVTIFGSNVNDQTKQLRVSEQLKGNDKYFIPAGAGLCYCGIINYSRANLRYRFRLSATITTSENAVITLSTLRCLYFTAISAFAPVGQVLSSPISFPMQAGVPTKIVFERTCVVESNVNPSQKQQGVAIFLSGVSSNVSIVYEDLDFSAEQDEQAYFYSSFVDVSKESFSKNTSLLDHFKGFCHIFDARIEEDLIARKVTIMPNKSISHPSDQLVASMFRKNTYSLIAEKYVEGSAQVSPSLPLSTRSVLFSWKPSTDSYIKSLNYDKEIYSREITFAKRARADVLKVENPTYEPTAERQTTLLATADEGRRASPYFPVMLDNTDGRRSFNISPRIFLFFGIVQQYEEGKSSLKPASFYFDSVPYNAPFTPIANFAYLSMLPTWELLASNFDKQVSSLVWGRRPFDLFTMSYLGFVASKRGGSEITAKYKISVRDYMRENFRSLLRFRFKGRSLSGWATEISEFDAGESGEATIKMFFEPTNPSCCDQPCGCVYSVCDYAQPFTIQTSGSVVSASKITEFSINSIAQINSDVQIGDMNIIDINEAQYVTNLADALNSIDAELSNYFRFEYSTQKNSDDKLMFFKIIRPACWTFKIKIEMPNDVVIEYTHDSNTDIDGYSSPINCLQYEEY